MQDNVADGLAAVASHPVTVQVINQGPGIWGNVATGLITAGAAIAAVMLTHRFTLRREKRASEEKLKREQYYISTELVFLLEQFGEDCVSPASDYGDREDEQGLSVPNSRMPQLSFSGITGDWRSLPPGLMYRLRELEVKLSESHNALNAECEYDEAPYFTEYFFRRRQHAVRHGLLAFILASRLRKLCGMPVMKYPGKNWSSPGALKQQYREQIRIRHRKRRSGMVLSFEILSFLYEKRMSD